MKNQLIQIKYGIYWMAVVNGNLVKGQVDTSIYGIWGNKDL